MSRKKNKAIRPPAVPPLISALLAPVRSFFGQRDVLIMLVLICFVGLFYLLTLRPGHTWGDDFAQYIHHAKNIVEGKPYADVHYLYNPYNPIAPRTEPPVFPLLLSVVYRVAGLNLTAMKIENLAIFLGALFVIFLMLRPLLPRSALFPVILLIGMHPFFWSFKDNVLSDIPFLFFTYLFLLVLHRRYQVPSTLRTDVRYAALVALTFSLAYGTRTIGVALLAVVVLYEIMQARRVTRFLAMIVALSLAIGAFQSWFFHGVGKNMELFYFNPQVIVKNINLYRLVFTMLWYNGYSLSVAVAVTVTLGVCVLIGYLVRVSKEISVYELFFAIYLVPVLIWPYFDGPRFIFPLLPLYLYYAFLGVRSSGELLGRWLQRDAVPRIGTIAFFGVLFWSCLLWYTKAGYGPMEEGVGLPTTKALFTAIRTNTGPDDVFICTKPRALGLFTQRSSAVYFETTDDMALWKYLKTINASYIVAGKMFPSDRTFLIPFILRYKDSFQEVFTNDDFKIYRIIKN